MKNYVITIARGFGSGGFDIGQRLSNALGIPCYEREIIEMAAEQTGLDVGLFMQSDEKLRKKYILKNIKTIPTHYVVKPNEKEFISNDNLYNIESEIIRSLAFSTSCIIVGKCADHILADFPNVISVYIEAPRACCVESIMKKLNVSEKKAHKLIKSTDSYRANYYRYYTRGKDWTNPTNYDIVLNTGRVKREECVELICAYVDMKFPGHRSSK
ncbi:MAG: cytidylate kinase-like family protein [Lachnospiraceae bacterium]|nr:cytidylate kinase-like family protein [Lachnospiraceae bacterium]